MTAANGSNSEGRTGSAAEMTCREVVELVSDYLENRLPEKERRRFEQHLEDCPYCATYLEQMRQAIATLGELREESLSPEVRDGLLAAFREWREGQRH